MPAQCNPLDASLTEELDRFDDFFDFHYPSLRAKGTYRANYEGLTAQELSMVTDGLIDSLPPSGFL
ncbi:hypothetical protein [Rhodococcus sp. UNC363MFTsu5.1]|uniref:hypothetical protein n=1 Tax=Rhodococcus sp. UNC363MFTsu5.1 TaxID=1449069 RepID=UPI0004831DEF|nr:hypothetical protein [Rhodococcus sp. UNC363MFTsu5.1]